MLTAKRLTPEAVIRWRRKDTWTIYETGFLLCGYESPSDMRAERENPDDVRETAENMGGTPIAGRLRTIGPEEENGRKYMLRQRDVIASAASAYLEFPLAAAAAAAIPAARNLPTDRLPSITLPAGMHIVPTMALPALIAEAFHPGADPDGTDIQAALRAYARMLNKAAQDGRVTVVPQHGEPITLGTADATGCAGAYLTVAELERHLSELAVPIALRIGEPGAQEPVQAYAQPARADALGKLLDEAIETITQEDQPVTAQAVFHWLRPEAEAKRPRFTGVVTASRLHWLTSAGTNWQLTVDAVRDRLRRRKRIKSTRNRTR